MTVILEGGFLVVIRRDSWQRNAPISVLHKYGNEGESLCERFTRPDRPAGPEEANFPQ